MLYAGLYGVNQEYETGHTLDGKARRFAIASVATGIIIIIIIILGSLSLEFVLNLMNSTRQIRV